MRTICSLIFCSLLAACSSLPSRPHNHGARRFSRWRHLSAKADVPPPAWIEHTPRSLDSHFFVGESIGETNREQALEKAWISAFVRIGMTEFPELTQVSSESVETLHKTSYRRKFALNLEKVRWTGIREATEYGSPYLDRDPRSGRYVVYRLLKWFDADMSRAKQAIADNAIHSLPQPPEETEREQKELVQAVQAIHSLNARASQRELLLDRVLGDVKCGITVGDLIQVLGAPDRYNPYNANVLEKEYYWGSYRVERWGDDPKISSITKENGKSTAREICYNPLQEQLASE